MNQYAPRILFNSASPMDNAVLVWLIRGDKCFLKLTYKLFVSMLLNLAISMSQSCSISNVLTFFRLLVNFIRVYLHFLFLHHQCASNTLNPLAVVNKQNLKSLICYFFSNPRTFYFILLCSPIGGSTSYKSWCTDGLCISSQLSCSKLSSKLATRFPPWLSVLLQVLKNNILSSASMRDLLLFF